LQIEHEDLPKMFGANIVRSTALRMTLMWLVQQRSLPKAASFHLSFLFHCVETTMPAINVSIVHEFLFSVYTDERTGHPEGRCKARGAGEVRQIDLLYVLPGP